jgi:hypothetical protein
MNEELVKRLKSLAEKRSDYDHLNDDDYFDPQDMSGGNFDDCYSMGIDEGYTQLAREVLDMLNVDYTIPDKRK